MTSRTRLSPTVNRFLARQFFGPFLACLTAFTVAYLLGDLFDRFSDLLRYGGLGLIGLKYFTLKLPLIITQLLPIASLAGVLLGFAMLNRTGEVLACQQLGVSRFAMVLPVLVVALGISLFDFTLSETVVPYTTREARYLYMVQLKKRKLEGVFANQRIWMRIKGGFMSADSYDSHDKELHGVTLYRLGPNYHLKNIVTAKNARWTGSAWEPSDLRSLSLGRHGTIKSIDTQAFKLTARPKDFGMLRLDPEEFSLWELRSYIQGLRRKGLDPGGYVVDLDLKYALPFACLIMVALGLGLSLDPLPRQLSLGRSFGLAIAFGFGYWLALGVTSSLGRSNLFPPLLAAWLPNLTFAMVAASIFLFGEEH